MPRTKEQGNDVRGDLNHRSSCLKLILFEVHWGKTEFARRFAVSARSCAEEHARPPRDRRTPVRHPQGLDGRHPLQDQNPRKGPNRDEPPRSGLQSEACDRHRGCPAPDGGHAGLRPRLKSSCFSARPSKSENRKLPAGRPSADNASAFLHSLDGKRPSRLPSITGSDPKSKSPLNHRTAPRAHVGRSARQLLFLKADTVLATFSWWP